MELAKFELESCSWQFFEGHFIVLGIMLPWQQGKSK